MPQLTVTPKRKGPGRKAKPTHIRISVFINKETSDRADKLALSKKWTRSYTVDQILRHFMGMECDQVFLDQMEFLIKIMQEKAS